MNNHDLMPRGVRQAHSLEIKDAETFRTHGVSARDAKDFLNTPEGTLYWQRVAAADPSASALEVDKRVLEQLASGRELPRMEIFDEPLVKLTPVGTDVSPYSPYFARRSVIDDAHAAGKSLHDYLGLPGKSESARYRMDEARPLAPTEVFISHVAPTSELGGQFVRSGGAEQVLLPNRKLFTAPEFVGYIDNSLALQAERRVGIAVKGAASGVAVAAALYDGYSTAEQYQALTSQGNQFGADALLRRYEGRTAGGVLGGIVTGAGYGLLAGSETGPGAFVTGAVGGVLGAFAGEEIAKRVTEHRLNHQVGRDGVTYAYEKGQWVNSESRLSLRAFHLPTIQESRNPAPEGQVPYLEYRRSSAVTSLMLAEPVLQDTKNITLDGRHWQATDNGWVEKVVLPHTPSPFEIPAPTYGQTADGETGRQLDQLAANRQFNNEHYAEDVAQAYVMDHIGRGWSALGPMPDAVTHALKLPSEERSTDPVTGNRWTATGVGSFERTVALPAYIAPVTEQVRPGEDERGRLASQQASAMAVNAAYGRELIARQHAQLQADVPERAASAASSREGASGAGLRAAQESPALEHTIRAPMQAQVPRSYSDPGHPEHALYNALRQRLPGASEDRLVQFTAACHMGRIEADKLAHVFVDDQKGIASFAASWPPGALAQVDLAKPAPAQQESMQRVQAHDQQQAQQAAEFAVGRAQISQQHGNASVGHGY